MYKRQPALLILGSAVTIVAVAVGLFPTVAAIIGPKDNRMTYPEYIAKKLGNDVGEFHEKFSAAGNFWCVNSAESASVVGRNDILIVAAHSVVEKERGGGRCVQRPNLGRCFYQPIQATGTFGRKITIRPLTLRFSQKHSCNDAADFYNDWAIVRLTSAATEVVPFVPLEVTDYSSRENGYGELATFSIIALAAQNANFRHHPLATPTICDGVLGFIWQSHLHTSTSGSYGIGTNCSSGAGDSGGAVLTVPQKDRVFYAGLISGGKNSSYDYRPFDNSNFSAGPLLQGEFYDVLQSMMNH
jgi:hypothetical protein